MKSKVCAIFLSFIMIIGMAGCTKREDGQFSDSASDSDFLLTNSYYAKILDLIKSEDKASSYEAKLSIDYFNLCNDWDRRNQIGMEPVKPYFQTIEDFSSVNDINRYLQNIEPYEMNASFFTVSLYQDPLVQGKKYPIVNAFSPIFENDEMLPDSSKHSVFSTEDYLSALLKKAGYSKRACRKIIKNAVSFEKKITEGDSKEALGEAILSDKEIASLYSNYPILKLSQKIGADIGQVRIEDQKRLTAFSKCYIDENLDEIKAYLICKTIYSFAPHLDRECYDLYERFLYQRKEDDPKNSDEERAINLTINEMYQPVARFFTDCVCTDEDQFRISWMIQDLLMGYYDLLNASELSEKSKKGALNQLSLLDVYCMRPDDRQNTEETSFSFASKEDGGSYFEAFLASRKYAYESGTVLAFEGDKEDEFLKSGIYYDAPRNLLTVTSRILSMPIYSKDMQDEVLYGYFGMQIARELAKTFDFHEDLFDANGNLTDWWDESDQEKINEKLNRFYALWEEDFPKDSLSSENDAIYRKLRLDLAAMQCLLYVASQKEVFDFDLFFRSYANSWYWTDDYENREIEPAFLKDDLKYAPVCVILRQFDAFYQTYGLNESDKNYLLPEERIYFW